MTPNPPNHTAGRCGTSYASPTALRSGTAVRAHFGAVLNPLAIRALMMHRCHDRGHNHEEVGRGRLRGELADLMICDPASVTTIYQGTLDPKQYLRALVPFPKSALKGMVRLTATICFATETDPQDTINYTRSGVDVTFRPHSQKYAKPSLYKHTGKPSPAPKHPKSATFFSSSVSGHEADLRTDEHKWETVLHASRSCHSKSLHDPMLDIHYNPREGGADAVNPQPIPYAMVITLTAPKSPTLFNDVVRRYPGQLVQLKPVIAIPIRR